MFDPKRDLHTVPNNGSFEDAVPPATKKVKLATTTSAAKKTSVARTIPVTKNKKALKVLAAAKMISLKADPAGELPIKSTPLVKQEAEATVMVLPTNQ